jgi:hypothetical protein
MPSPAVLESLDALFAQMVAQQREKVLALARQRNPKLTAEDIMNPENFPEIDSDGPFNFEDGILSGLVSAQIAVRAEFKRLSA